MSKTPAMAEGGPGGRRAVAASQVYGEALPIGNHGCYNFSIDFGGYRHNKILLV